MNTRSTPVTRASLLEARVVLVGCAARKRDVASPASELYTGELFKRARALAEKLQAVRPSVAWFILSAKHGLVSPTTVLEPYDLKLDEFSKYDAQAWGWRVHKALAPVGGPVLCLAGESYAKWIPGSHLFVRPLAGLKLGEQISQLPQLASLL